MNLTGSGVAIAALYIAAMGGHGNAQEPVRAKPLPPRIAPTDYQSQGRAGAVMIGADFAGHGVPTENGTFSSEGYIVVELGIYGAPGSKLNLSYKDFSLRVNGKKNVLPAQTYESVFHSLKDPEWIPPEPVESKSKSGINAGGGGGGSGAGDAPPPPPKMPLPLVLQMEQKVKMASLPEGERPLPNAGLIFFQYGGNLKNIRSLELVYSGAAGKATLILQ